MATGNGQQRYLDGRESVAELIALLGHSSLRVRRSAVAALERREPSETMPGLLEALSSEENAAARNSAGDVLLRYGPRIIPPITRALDPDNHRDRTIQILGLLARLPCRDTVDAVVPLATHADASVAAAAIGCLAGQRDPACVPTLLAVLDSGERWQTFYAIDALGEIGHAAAVNRLVPLTEDAYYRKAVLRALGRIGDESVIEPLVRALVHGPRPDKTALAALNEMVGRARTDATRAEMVERIRHALSAVDGESLSAALTALLRRASPTGRTHAVCALGWLGGASTVATLVECLAEAALAEVAGIALVSIGAEHAGEVMRATGSVALPASGLSRVIETIASVPGQEVETFLTQAMEHEDDEVRQTAAAALADRVAASHLDLLVKALGDPSPHVAEEAVRGLLALAAYGEFGREQVAGRIDALTVSPTPEIRRAALRIIVRIGGEGARETLDTALHDPVAAVRREATSLLGQDPDPERLWRLTAALADEDARVREEAVLAVGRMHDKRARGVLLASLHDRSIWVRCRAARALADHPAVEVRAALEEAAREEVLPVRVSAVEALGYLRPATDPLLAELSHDPEAEIRRAVLRAFTVEQTQPPMDLLVVGLEDPVWSVRCSAADALGSSAHSGSFGPLSHALDREADAVVQRRLLAALFAVDAEASLPFLVTALSEKDVADTAADLLVEGHEVFADELRAEWASGVDPATREGLALVLEEMGRRESAPPGHDDEAGS